jgi:hypothetical protein
MPPLGAHENAGAGKARPTKNIEHVLAACFIVCSYDRKQKQQTKATGTGRLLPTTSDRAGDKLSRPFSAEAWHLIHGRNEKNIKKPDCWRTFDVFL